MVDHQGIADDAVDADGWSYATDFSWLRMPPAPNSGHRSKVTITHILCLPACITFPWHNRHCQLQTN